jgi:hypothetical protein
MKTRTCLTRICIPLIPFLLGWPLPSQASEFVAIMPSQDNTMFEEDSAESNGQGTYLFSGRTGSRNGFASRRALLSFDVGSVIPAGSVITSVTLEMKMDRTVTGSFPFSLHRLTRSWGEGASNAVGVEGAGDQAEAGDATWVHAFYPNENWSTPGGDFVAVASATRDVGATGIYSWTGSGLVEDVQSWLENPLENFGWILIGPTDVTSAKRFLSSEAFSAADRPKLTIGYSIGQPTWAGYPVNADGRSVFTESWLSWIDISAKPFIYVYNLRKYIYAPEGDIGSGGLWVWIPRAQPGPGGDNTWADYPLSPDGKNVDTLDLLAFLETSKAPWVYVYDIGKYIYIPEGFVSGGGAWAWIGK